MTRARFDNPAGVPAPGGNYSHVARVDCGDVTVLLVSGQLAVDDHGALVGPGDMTAQTSRVFELLEAILSAHGAGFEHVINIRSHLTDLGLVDEYAAVRRRYFSGTPPTSTTVGVSGLIVPGALLEVDVVAVIDAPAR